MKKASVSLIIRIAIIPVLLIAWGLDQTVSAKPKVEDGGATSVTVNEIHPYQEFEDYTYVEATVHGIVNREDGTEGKYAVPIVLIYPNDGGNGVGVVDWLVTIGLQHGDFTATADRWRPHHSALTVTDGYLFESGFTYAAVQWDKAVTDYFGPPAADQGEKPNHLIFGTIEEPEDAFDILLHTAGLLKYPDLLQTAFDIMPVDAVLSFGYSQSAGLQMEFMSRGVNLRNSELAYDGHLLAKVGLLCLTFHNEPPGYYVPEACNGVPVEDGTKVIHVAAQGDVEAVLYAGLSRFPDNPHWRQYELAGVSHLPSPISPGLNENQNPASSKPVFRAAFHNLARWVKDGVPAPPSRFIEGTLNTNGTFDTDLDEDGNAIGGLRLPHMEQIIDGTLAGAPLGRYTGKHPEGNPDELFWFGGYFEPFPPEEIAERYPDKETYVKRVTLAADYLLEGGYIHEEDRNAYVQEAKRTELFGTHPEPDHGFAPGKKETGQRLIQGRKE